MGGGNWNTSAYDAARTFRAASGQKDFDYDDRMRRTPSHQRKAADILDPYGLKVREARDSAEHPHSTPVAIFFDVTGSMGSVPKIMQQRLPDLFSLLLRGGYVEDPQVLFGGIGDEDYDRVPLQVGQFESDNRADEQLRQMYLEGGGGGDKRESYALAVYTAARHFVTDAWERRGKKGHLFLIGDEANKARLRARAVSKVLGEEINEDMDIEALYREAQERWNVYYILPKQTAYYDDPTIAEHWRSLLGERFLRLEDPAGVCDLIALTIGLQEDAISLDEGLCDLLEIGSSHGQSVGKALSTMGAGGRSMTTTDLPQGLSGDDDLA